MDNNLIQQFGRETFLLEARETMVNQPISDAVRPRLRGDIIRGGGTVLYCTVCLSVCLSVLYCTVVIEGWGWVGIQPAVRAIRGAGNNICYCMALATRDTRKRTLQIWLTPETGRRHDTIRYN